MNTFTVIVQKVLRKKEVKHLKTVVELFKSVKTIRKLVY